MCGKRGSESPGTEAGTELTSRGGSSKQLDEPLTEKSKYQCLKCDFCSAFERKDLLLALEKADVHGSESKQKELSKSSGRSSIRTQP